MSFPYNCFQEDCNSTWINTGDLPALTFLRSLSAVDLALVIVSAFGAAGSVSIYTAQIVIMYRHKCNIEYIRLATTLLALYPVYLSISCVAMFTPRASQFMTVLMATYTMIAFNDFGNMLAFTCGGFKALAVRLDGKRLQLPKICCCLSKTRWSRSSLRVGRLLVRQARHLHFFYVTASGILLLNGNYQTNPLQLDRPLFWVGAVAAVSRILATMSLVTLVRSTVPVLDGYRLGKKFIAMQLANVTQIVLEFLLALLLAWGVSLEPYGLVSAENRADLYRYFTLMIVTLGCQLWSAILFHHTETPRVSDKPEPAAENGAAGIDQSESSWRGGSIEDGSMDRGAVQAV